MQFESRENRVTPTTGAAGFDWTDWALFIVLGTYPLFAAIRAWTFSDDIIMILWGITLLGGLLRGQPFVEARQWISALACPAGFIALAFVAYALATLAWSTMTPDYWQIHVVKTAAIFVISTVVAKRLADVPSPQFQRWLAVSVAAGFVLFAVDGAMGHKLVQMFYGPPEDRRINPSAVALSLLLWPALATFAITGWRVVALALWLFAGFVLLQSPSQASFTGYLVGTAMLLIAWRLPRSGVWLAVAGAVAGTLAVPLLPWLAALSVKFLPASFLAEAAASSRIDIWSRFVATEINSTLFGEGALHLGRTHPHNFPLQILSEFGLVGIALSIALLITAGSAFLRIEKNYRPFALACAVAIYLNAYVSYGIWEIEFLSIMLLSSLVVVHGVYSSRKTAELQ